MAVKLNIRDLFEKVSELVFPSKCVSCKVEGSFFCDSCVLNCAHLGGNLCQICSDEARFSICDRCQRSPYFDKIVAPFQMTHPITKAVYALKYGDLRALAPRLSFFMFGTYQRENISADMVLAVPIHKKRLRERGYNQAEILAKRIAKMGGIPYVKGIDRVKHSESLTKLTYEEREYAVNGAFKLAKKAPLFEGKSVLLVDDVCTTASTLNAVAKVLKGGGAKEVFGLVLAREFKGES